MPRDSPDNHEDASQPQGSDETARHPRVRFIGESYRLLFEKNPLPMWVFDVKSLYFLAVNDAAVAHYGYSRNEFLRMTIKDIRPPEDVPALMADLRRLDSGTESIGIWRHIKRDGTIVDVEIRGNEIDFDGHRARIILANDITERLRAERQLRTGYAVTQVLAEAASFREAIPRLLRAICEAGDWDYGEIWLTDPSDEYLRREGVWYPPTFQGQEFEAAARDLAIVRGTGIVGETWSQGRPRWISDLASQPHTRRAELGVRLGLRQALSFPMRTRGRVNGVMAFFARSARDPDDAFLDLMADLGERIGQSLEGERSEGERRRLEERFSKAFYQNPLPAAISRLNDGYLIDVNESFLRMFAYAREEVIGRTSLELSMWSSPADRERIMAQAASGRSLHGEEVDFRTRSGEIRRALVSVETVTLAQEPTVLTTLVDVTDLRELQRRLADMERLASISETAAFVAHEINTPLTNIALTTASIARLTQDSAIREKLEKIDTQRRLAARIITEILSVTRSTEILQEPTDLSTLVHVAADQAASYRAPEVSLVLDLGEHPVTAAVDPLKTLQVFVNLIKNAYQATVQGTVTFTLREQGDNVVATVKDTGKGIDPKDRDRLFRPFFTTKARGEGVGLGLTFVKAVVEAHGGRIDLASAPGEGTTFTITLPRKPSPRGNG